MMCYIGTPGECFMPKTWMVGTSAAMTLRVIAYEARLRRLRPGWA
jgi:hypothetical protein